MNGRTMPKSCIRYVPKPIINGLGDLPWPPLMLPDRALCELEGLNFTSYWAAVGQGPFGELSTAIWRDG